MSGYLALAKRVGKDIPRSPETLAAEKQRKLEEANRRGLLVCWSEHPTWIKLHDPTTGEWHEVKASECPPSLLAEANTNREGGAA